MRLGTNPVKLVSGLPAYGSHRLIMPIYIPTLEGYYHEAPEVLRLCLTSLRATAAGRLSVTLIANGCVDEVTDELRRQFKDGWIDELQCNRINRGKVDAVLARARGAVEPLITIADCDALFMVGWVDAVENVFQAFPECGCVSPLPAPHLATHYTSATMVGAAAKGELDRRKVVDDEDLEQFAHSISNPGIFSAPDRAAQWSVQRDGCVCCVGCGHFVVTMRREAFEGSPQFPSRGFGGAAERHWLDEPPDVLGFWKLATTKSHVFHMGNHPEPWMYEVCPESTANVAAAPAPAYCAPARRHWTAQLPLKCRYILCRVIWRFI